MKVYFVGAGPGDVELLTLKAKRLLETCLCCIYAGSLISDEIMAFVPKGVELHDSSSMTLGQIVDVVDKCKKSGVDVVRLHSGEPSIYGAIMEQMNELDKLSIGYEVVPGISSFQAAAAALCLELTVPEEVQTVILTRAAGRTPVPPQQDLANLAKARATMCIFLSVGLMGDVVKKLTPEYGADTPVAVVFHASRPDQKIIAGFLGDIEKKIKDAEISKTAMIIVGKALLRSGAVSRLYSADFSHCYRQT
jgi:precorrin-4/cobalt-precorrin-4 C11-methyltransferase